MSIYVTALGFNGEPGVPAMSTDPITEVADRFARETKNHTMTVLRDDGLYRHLRFKAPDNGFYWFDLITWPGYLTFVGDGEGYVFTRIEDMFGFFRGSRINPQYWAEKVVDGRGRLKTYSEERFRQLVTEHLDQVADDYPAGLREALCMRTAPEPCCATSPSLPPRTGSMSRSATPTCSSTGGSGT